MVITNRIWTPVPAVPLKPPPLNLVDSANQPADDTDGRWTGGLTYLPESRAAATVRDGDSFTAVDLPALAAPTGLAGAPNTTGGTLAAHTHGYQVTSVNGNGETTALTAISVTTTGATGSVTLTWNSDPAAVSYNVYGQIAAGTGAIGLLANVPNLGFGDDSLPSTLATYIDVGAVSVGAAPPSANTTAGGGKYYTEPSIIQFVPFLAEVDDSCSAFGWEAHAYIGRASRLLEVATPAAVEAEFWSGALAQAMGYPNDYLTNSATVTDLTPGTVPSIPRGIQILEDANASTSAGGKAMLHLMPEDAPSLLNARRVGNLLYSELDNIIVPGSGYLGTGPGGAAAPAGTTWIYITDIVNVRLDTPRVFPDNFAEALDRGQADQPNTIAFRAERFAACDFSGLVHFGCKV